MFSDKTVSNKISDILRTVPATVPILRNRSQRKKKMMFFARVGVMLIY